MAYIFIKYLHIIGIMVLMATLVLEHQLLKPHLTPAEVGKLAVVDAVYGLAAGVVLTAGFLLWFVVGKGAAFYTPNPVLHIKITLFAVMALLSIYPSLFFLKNRKSQLPTVTVPKSVVLIVRLELLLMLPLPLLAVLMAQGYGLAG